jgi:hypothetical protein
VIAFKGVIKKEYERQVVINHPSKLSYPLEITLENWGEQNRLLGVLYMDVIFY